MKNATIDYIAQLFDCLGPTGGPVNDLPPYFSRLSFRCGCCCNSDTVVDAELIRILGRIYEHFERDINIISGFRCVDFDAFVNEKHGDYHTTGKAADFTAGVEPEEIAKFLDDTFYGKYGVGVYQNYLHLDVRPGFERWHV